MKDNSIAIIIGVGILTGINGLMGDWHLKRVEKNILDAIKSHGSVVVEENNNENDQVRVQRDDEAGTGDRSRRSEDRLHVLLPGDTTTGSSEFQSPQDDGRSRD